MGKLLCYLRTVRIPRPFKVVIGQGVLNILFHQAMFLLNSRVTYCRVHYYRVGYKFGRGFLVILRVVIINTSFYILINRIWVFYNFLMCEPFLSGDCL